MLFMDTSWHHRTTRMTFYALIEHLISDLKVQVRTNKICLLNISRPSLKQSDFPTKLTIEIHWPWLSFGISHVSMAISKYSYEQLSITFHSNNTSLNKNNDLSYMHVDNWYALVPILNLLNELVIWNLVLKTLSDMEGEPLFDFTMYQVKIAPIKPTQLWLISVKKWELTSTLMT